MLFTNTIIEMYPSLRGLSCILVWEREECEGDSLQVGVGRTSQGGWGKIRERITEHCKQVGLGSFEISVHTTFND